MMLYVLLVFLGVQTRAVLSKDIHIHLYPDELKELDKKADAEESEEANRLLPPEDLVTGNGQNRQYPLNSWAYSKDPGNAVNWPLPRTQEQARQIHFIYPTPTRPNQVPRNPPPYVGTWPKGAKWGQPGGIRIRMQ